MKKHSNVKAPKVKTNIKAGPHVNESDGGQWDWDVRPLSFVLPDGTKITCKTLP